MEREKILEQLRENPNVSVLVIGAGINGIGVFRDLALNGIDVVLIDRGDFCSGASAASSHMAHGGIRYLENGEFRLVREAIQERTRLIENAPHIVRPLPTVIPIFKLFSGLLNAPLKFFNLLNRPSERGALIIKLGLVFYDAFTLQKTQGAAGRQRTVPPHTLSGRTKSLQQYPKLNPTIQYTARYYDGQILSPERLATELVLDAEVEGPHARALNYVSFVGIQDGKVILRDELPQPSNPSTSSGHRLPTLNLQPETFHLQPKIIINATGPWIDPVNTALGLSRHYIGGTKGSHLVLNHPELRDAIGPNEFFFENSDGRIVLIFPFHDKVIIGASDIPIENADEARCTEEEIDYFLGMVARVFPTIHVGHEHIVFRFSGVRPLAYAQAKTTGQLGRDHVIHEDSMDGIPVYSLVGGKWTTYRAFAEQATDKVLTALGRDRRTGTGSLTIGGGRDYPQNEPAKGTFVASLGLPSEQAQRLFARYGTRASLVAEYLRTGAADAPLSANPAYTHREIEFLITQEKAVHVDDLLIRRSTLAWLGQATLPLVEELAEVMGNALGWNNTEKKTEIERTVEILQDKHGVRLA